MTVEVIVRNGNGEIVLRLEGSAHEPLRWNGEPLLDVDAGLQLHRVFYDPDSRPIAPVKVQPAIDRRAPVE